MKVLTENCPIVLYGCTRNYLHFDLQKKIYIIRNFLHTGFKQLSMWETFKKSEQLLHIIITEIHKDHDLYHQVNRMMKERLVKSIVYLPTTEQYDIAKIYTPLQCYLHINTVLAISFPYFVRNSSHKNYRMWEKNYAINIIGYM